MKPKAECRNGLDFEVLSSGFLITYFQCNRNDIPMRSSQASMKRFRNAAGNMTEN